MPDWDCDLQIWNQKEERASGRLPLLNVSHGHLSPGPGPGGGYTKDPGVLSHVSTEKPQNPAWPGRSKGWPSVRDRQKSSSTSESRKRRHLGKAWAPSPTTSGYAANLSDLVPCLRRGSQTPLMAVSHPVLQLKEFPQS